jgi:hypothetical protein
MGLCGGTKGLALGGNKNDKQRHMHCVLLYVLEPREWKKPYGQHKN